MTVAHRFFRAPTILVSLFALAGCSSPTMSTDAGEAGDVPMVDVPTRSDFINVNCTSAAGDEGAADCNQRLMNMSGTHFFIGGASQCYPDPSSPLCVPLCTLDDVNATNCTFNAMTPGSGCRYNQAEGYRVVVENAAGLRWTAATSTDGVCASVGSSYRHWARVRFDDLTGAAACLASMPAGGLGPPRYLTCPTPMAACGTVAGDTCNAIPFMGPTGMYTANVCTKMCMTDDDCGGRGSCYNGLCFGRCGGACSISCDTGFNCGMPMGATTTICLPRPPGQ